jgi:hypothetical protein
MQKESITNLLKRIEFWIVFFLLIRLVGITNPPLEIGHNWRQVTGLMVARNYIEVDDNILYPRIDDNQGGTGIIGMEFPTMNYIYFLITKIFGYTHWYGRLINLIISSIGVFFFYKILKKYFDPQHAFISTLCLIGSIWLAFSRKMMPDTFCISLMMIGIYYGTEYLDFGKLRDILLFVLFSSIAILSKIPAGIYLIIFIPLFFYNKNLKQKLILAFSSLIPLSLTYFWYFIWNPKLSSQSGIWYNSGKELSVGFNEVISNLGLVAEKFYFSAFSSYLLFSCFIAGLFLIFYKKKNKLIYPFIFLTVIFIIYMFKSGFFFYHHNYYIIPFVPVMALIGGYAISLIKKRWIFISILSLGIIESIANQQHDFFIKNSEKYKLELEAIADSICKRNDLIAINGNDNPQMIYLTHRKGWTCNDQQLNDSLFIKDISKKGCKFIFINKHNFKGSLKEKNIFENTNFVVYQLNKIENN